MEPNPARDGITLQSRTLSHYLLVRKVAELVGDAARLHSLRREWQVELRGGRLAATWNALLAALRRDEGAAAWEVVLLEDRHDEVNAVATRSAEGARDVLRLQVAPHTVTAWLYGDALRCTAAVAALRAALATVTRIDDPDQVAVRFWHQLGDGSANAELRRIHCPRFAAIAANYPACGAELERLIALASPWEHGRLVFWHGPPGTGKTWALRALIREWSALSAEVITDPDAFFSSNAYLQQVLLAEPTSPAGGEGGTVRADERPRLFILEDAPQLLLQESRAAQGTRMANLLAMTDGILGQGLRAIFLVTTNEKVHRLDPAIRRPGRCLQELELPNFTAEQARAWLAARGCTDAVTERGGRELPTDGELSLAELYERLQRGAPVPRGVDTRLGFAAPDR